MLPAEAAVDLDDELDGMSEPDLLLPGCRSAACHGTSETLRAGWDRGLSGPAPVGHKERAGCC